LARWREASRWAKCSREQLGENNGTVECRDDNRATEHVLMKKRKFFIKPNHLEVDLCIAWDNARLFDYTAICLRWVVCFCFPLQQRVNENDNHFPLSHFSRKKKKCLLRNETNIYAIPRTKDRDLFSHDSCKKSILWWEIDINVKQYYVNLIYLNSFAKLLLIKLQYSQIENQFIVTLNTSYCYLWLFLFLSEIYEISLLYYILIIYKKYTTCYFY